MNKGGVIKIINKMFRGREFDRNIFYVMAAGTCIASLSGLIVGPILNSSFVAIATSCISAIYLILAFIFHKNKNYSEGNKYIVGVTGYGLFTVIFMATYGINSAFPLYMLLIPAVYGVICNKKRDIISPLLNLALYDWLLYKSFYSKELVEIRIVPFLIGFSTSYILIFCITSYLSFFARSLIKRLTAASTIDELTQIYNRRCFDLNFRNFNYKIAAIFDIDDFKKVNDVFGHQCGDVILMEFAKILKKHSSDEFKPYRWGGEEFVILSKLDMQTSINQIRKIFDETRMELKAPDGKTVTVSCGISETLKVKLMKTIDENLYQAKNSGKNKLVFNKKVIY